MDVITYVTCHFIKLAGVDISQLATLRRNFETNSGVIASFKVAGAVTSTQVVFMDHRCINFVDSGSEYEAA